MIPCVALMKFTSWFSLANSSITISFLDSDFAKTAVFIDAGSVHTSAFAYDETPKEVFKCEVNSDRGISSVQLDDLENYLFESKCMKRLFKARPGNKFIVIGGTSGMRDLAEKNPEKVFILFKC